MEDIDGCAKQYRSASSLYLMSTLSMKYGVIIDCVVGEPEHSKDVADGLIVVDKMFLQTAMLRNINPEEHSTVKLSAATLQQQCDQ
eukprot:2076414-Ditylum_brightwellii.AAC.1